MQLLKITTTPIKYRVETERASFTLADSDNYDSLGSVKESVRKIDTAKNSHGIPSSNTGIIYLILVFFGLGIIAYALMQDSLNKLA